jgi:hypothetical protein
LTNPRHHRPPTPEIKVMASCLSTIHETAFAGTPTDTT